MPVALVLKMVLMILWLDTITRRMVIEWKGLKWGVWLIKTRCGECTGCQMLSGAGCGNCGFCKSGEYLRLLYIFSGFRQHSSFRRSPKSEPLPCKAVHEPNPDPASRLSGLPGQRWIRGGRRGGQEEEGEVWGVWGLQGELHKTMLNVTYYLTIQCDVL